MNGFEAAWPALLGSFFGLLCLFGAFRCGKRVRLVDCLPTSKTTGVFIGLVELKGFAEAGCPLTSYLTEQKCVFYSWRVEEQWSRTVTETYRDSQGRTQTRTRRETGWRTVASGGQQIPFYLRDDCGAVRILPHKAKVEPVVSLSETCGRLNPLYYGKGPIGGIADSNHRRRFQETIIPAGASLYIMGKARERTDKIAPEIAYDPDAPMFLISTRSEEQVSSRLRWGMRGFLFLGLLLTVGGVIGMDVLAERDPAGRMHIYPWVAAGYAAIAALGWTWMVYNSLIDLRNRVRRGWSLIDVQLKRRHDLIPNLVAAVQALRQHEEEVQETLAEMRAQLAPTAPGEEGPDPKAVAPMLYALAEKYPELKANNAFSDLHHHLVDTEHRIALARGYFNEIATHFRTRLEVIPDRWVGSLAGLQPIPLFEAAGFEREAVGIEFDEPMDLETEIPAGTADENA